MEAGGRERGAWKARMPGVGKHGPEQKQKRNESVSRPDPNECADEKAGPTLRGGERLLGEIGGMADSNQ